jgi:hypothetical protein
MGLMLAQQLARAGRVPALQVQAQAQASVTLRWLKVARLFLFSAKLDYSANRIRPSVLDKKAARHNPPSGHYFEAHYSLGCSQQNRPPINIFFTIWVVSERSLSVARKHNPSHVSRFTPFHFIISLSLLLRITLSDTLNIAAEPPVGPD